MPCARAVLPRLQSVSKPTEFLCLRLDSTQRTLKLGRNRKCSRSRVRAHVVNLALASMLGAVHGCISRCEQRGSLLPILWPNRDADTASD